MIAERLLRDAELTLEAAISSGEDVSPLHRAAMAWFAGASEQLQSTLATQEEPWRSYDLIAIAAFAEDAGWSAEDGRLDDGLRWLLAVSLERSGIPAPVTTDAAALWALGLAARRRPWLRPWHERVCAHAPAHVYPEWLRNAGALARGDIDADVRPEVRLAFAGRGRATPKQGDDEAVLAMLLEGALPVDPLHASLVRAAARWVRRVTPIALPRQARVEDVVELLKGVPRALQQWTWEEPTEKGSGRRWHIDNEYHVQNLLWALLAPVFPDLAREDYVEKVGPIQPRLDLGIPSLRLIIEVKFTRTRAALKKVVNEIAQDATNYFTKPDTYDRMIAFIWDDSRNSQDYDTVRAGLRQMGRVFDAVLVPRPGKMSESGAQPE